MAFLNYLMAHLQQQGITRFIFSLGHQAAEIQAYLQHNFPGLDADYISETTPLGTGGALVKAAQACTVPDVLVVNGDTSPGGVTTVSSGGAVGGSGTLGGLLLEEGGTLAPGNSPGTLHVDGNATWQGGGHYNWQVFLENPDAADQSLAGTGWDFIDIAGTLTLSGFDTSANRFHLNLWTLSGIAPDQNGPVGGFDPAVGSTWLIARADGGIILNSVSLLANTDYTGYFSIHTSPFNGTAGWAGALPQGGFRIFTMAEPIGLYLSANPTGVPEPNQLAASVFLLAGAGIGALIKRRCSKKRGLWIIHKKP